MNPLSMRQELRIWRWIRRVAVPRRMIELVKTINGQFFPDYKPSGAVGDESRLGKVTCFTCHQGQERPKTNP